MQGLLGRKIGMTQTFAEDGTVVPVTVLQAGPCLVVQRKSADTDGYEAVQIGLVEERPARKVGQPMEGHFKKAGVPPMKRLAEFSVDPEEEWKPGDQVKVGIFEGEEYVDVVGTGKGKGFQGVVRRHGFAGGRATHGSMFHRAPGSIGQASDPSRVFPGLKLPGRMGGKRITTKNLKVVKVDEENNLLFVRGSVPGARNGYVAICRAKRG
ncbi:MAG: 50S ribosomal protein L3 [Thermoanaerobaculia bacterium]|nr:50S ribosomal protein L3 [Thermoanaerobaculia bacterium]